MVPIELKLTNFMSYGSMEEPLSFTSFHTACLCGANGHGKSALLDAITWALWGRARGVDGRGTGTDDLIKHGEAFMSVEFLFELDGRQYRVARARDRAKSGTSRLSFSILEGSAERSLNGETIAKTQENIDRTLRMDFDTFTNSAFILQGKADSFMVKNPNERKEVLAEILGLSIYDELKEKANGARKNLEKELDQIDARIEFIDGELSFRVEYEEVFEKASLKASSTRAEIEKRESLLADLKEKKARRDATAERLEDLKKRISSAETEIGQWLLEVERAEGELSKLNELIERADEIEAGAARLATARSREEAMTALRARHAQISGDLQAAKRELAVKEAELRAEIESWRREKSALDEKAANAKSLQRQLADRLKRLEELNAMEAELEAARNEHSERSKRRIELDGKRDSILARMGELEEDIASIEDADACPLCRKGLDPNERESLLRDLEREIQALQKEVDSTASEMARLSEELKNIEERGKALAATVKEKGAIQAEIGRLESELRSAEEAKERSAEIQARISNVERSLSDGSFNPEIAAKIVTLEAELKSAGYDEAAYKEIRREIGELSHFERESFELTHAKERTSPLKERIASLKDSIDKKRASIDEDSARIFELESELIEEDVSGNIALLEAEIARLIGEEKASLDEAASAKGNIDRCDKMAEEKLRLLEERQRIADDVQIYAELEEAFSKRGIQALIIENAIPEIEDEANSILKKLTDGRMSVRFLTRKDQKTGGVVETLELVVSDGQQKERKYELFSGGEAFRINFAVRIALSKLLARRAGASLETLVIDEGFGTQDAEGLERIVEAISAIRSDFKKIIVVTHLDELKGAFPARIEVVKKPGIGSIATVI